MSKHFTPFAFALVSTALLAASCSGSGYANACNEDKDCGLATNPNASGNRCCKADVCKSGSRRGSCLPQCDNANDCMPTQACHDGYCMKRCSSDHDCSTEFRCRQHDGDEICVAE